MKTMIRGSNLSVVVSLLCFCFFFFFFFFFLSTFASPAHHSNLCRSDQKNALLSFKNEFQIRKHVLSCIPYEYMTEVNVTFYPKTKLWTDIGDCCSWEGVTCDDKLGVVTGLNLSYSGLAGILKPNSSLFRLKHLRSLDLAWNDLSGSSIPFEFGKLTRLTRLNLSSSCLSGRIPNELLQLIELVSLDLTAIMLHNQWFIPGVKLLFTETPYLSALARNLTNLQELRLGGTNISSIVPREFANMSSLRSLALCDCNLLGEFPGGVFLLPHIESISVCNNKNLKGSLPEFPANSSLRVLNLFNATFFGSMPNSIGKLASLESLILSLNNFSGDVPSSIGNLTSLKWLYLPMNNFVGEIPSSIGNLKSLQGLSLSSNNFVGEIPSSIGNLKSLMWLYLSYNKFSGIFSLGLLNQTELKVIDLSHNQLTVLLPSHIGNNVSGANASSTSYFLSSLQVLGLSACNITKIPEFLRTQQHLEYLILSSNKLKGQIPEWLWKLPLTELNLSHNSFSHFKGSSEAFSASNIQILDLSSNIFQGPFPSPPMSTQYLLASANNFKGNIPQSICKLNSLVVLDLSNNSFNGSIPPCLGNASDSLAIVSLSNNNFNGSLHDTFIRCANLKTLDIGHNKLTGKPPRSLLNCKKLEILNMESNAMSDTFPFWLKGLQGLKVLILRKNGFYGSMISSGFPNLQIMDISDNNFFGTLPSDYFGSWSAMSSIKTNEDSYVGNSPYYIESLVLTNKGIEMNYERILAILKAVDFSGNRFQGQIPESIGLLKELIVLNFSNNIFSGHIPQSLANLTELNSLDLSQNRLSGKIPLELGNIARLEIVNFSNNQFVGRIPQGTQFSTQDSSCFEGNLGLCGHPLEETCDANPSLTLPNQQSEQQEEEKEEEVSWIAVAIGYIPGLVFGLTIGHIMLPNKCEWFAKVFGFNRRRY